MGRVVGPAVFATFFSGRICREKGGERFAPKCLRVARSALGGQNDCAQIRHIQAALRMWGNTCTFAHDLDEDDSATFGQF